MDLLAYPPPIDLNDRSWIVHTRTEERPPVHVASGATVIDSMVSDGCVIAPGAIVERAVLSPGVSIGPGAVVRESVVLTDAVIGSRSIVEHSIVDKKVRLSENVRIGACREGEPNITMIGKNSHIPTGMVIEPGAVIGPDVIDSDFTSSLVRSGAFLQTKRLPYEI
jgi:glucose-1-phosphate adenylyltransferase